MAELIGKFTINPLVFISGKISGYITWAIMILNMFGYEIVPVYSLFSIRYFSYFLFFLGLIITSVSFINLGKSMALGIPSEKTSLKTNGLYEFSRNPMYLGFNFLTISSIIYTLNPVVLILGIYSIIVYHLIIIREEKFLRNRFKESYSTYCKKVRRYL